MIQKHIADMADLEKSRRSSLAPYIYTVYIAFFVFLAIALLLSVNFVPEIEKIKAGFDTKTPTPSGQSSPELFSAIKNFDPVLLKSMMYNMAIIESIFGGLTVGKISSGNYISGIKHVIMMLIITVVSFTQVG